VYVPEEDGPVGPVEPVSPVYPVGPVEPVYPVYPVGPVEPVYPLEMNNFHCDGIVDGSNAENGISIGLVYEL
jgi:hypothetical protein